ncbi:hypothetical protein ACOSQ3_005061 [Xanthoceras sorbifolium]
MRALGWWMLLGGLYRLASIWFELFNLWSKHHRGACSKYIFNDAYKKTLAISGLLTIAVGYICAFKLEDLKEKPLYMAIFLTLLGFLTSFMIELQINGTVDYRKLSPVNFLISTLVTWLFLR